MLGRASSERPARLSRERQGGFYLSVSQDDEKKYEELDQVNIWQISFKDLSPATIVLVAVVPLLMECHFASNPQIRAALLRT